MAGNTKAILITHALEYLLTRSSARSLKGFLVILVLVQLLLLFFDQPVQAGQSSNSTILCPPGFSLSSPGNCERESIRLPSQMNPCPPGFSVESSGLCKQIQIESETDQQEQARRPERMLSQENDFTTYRNDTLGVLTQYPSDWDLLSNIPFFDFGFFVAESAGLGVKIVQVPPPIDLDQIYATTYALLPFIIPKYQLISTGETTFIDNPAFYITFEGHLKPVYSEEYGRDIKVQTIFTVIDDKLYGIAYFGFKPVFEDYRPAAQSMIDSFGLTLENSFFAIRINGKNMNFGWLDKIPFGEYLRSSGADITADCFRVFIGYDELESPEAIKEYVPKENDRILISYGNQT